VLRAFVLRSTNRTDEAVTVLQDQLSQSPSAGLLRETYGMMLAADRRDEAATLLTSWLGDNPDDAGVLQLLGSQYIQDGDYPKALVAMERAFSLLPNNVVILNNLSWLRYEMKRPGAKELARRAYRMAPNAAAVADTLGWILVRDGEFGEGLKLLRAAADSAPKNGDIAYHVAYALHQTGDSDGAKAILERLMAEEFETQNFTERDHAAELLAKLKQG
jgi:Flp pilus assembly protein TadD